MTALGHELGEPFVGTRYPKVRQVEGYETNPRAPLANSFYWGATTYQL